MGLSINGRREAHVDQRIIGGMSGGIIVEGSGRLYSFLKDHNCLLRLPKMFPSIAAMKI
jgi:hypothetical protein